MPESCGDDKCALEVRPSGLTRAATRHVSAGKNARARLLPPVPPFGTALLAKAKILPGSGFTRHLPAASLSGGPPATVFALAKTRAQGAYLRSRFSGSPFLRKPKFFPLLVSLATRHPPLATVFTPAKKNLIATTPKSKNPGNPVPPKEIAKVNRNKTSTCGSPQFRPATPSSPQG